MGHRFFAPLLSLIVIGSALLCLGDRLRDHDLARARVAQAAQLGALDGERWFTLPRAYPTGRAPRRGHLDAAMRSVAAARGWRKSLSVEGDEWVSIGPRPIHVPGWIPYSGRVTAVAPHPTDARTLYLGADAGGIWKTTDGGVTWTPLTDHIPVPAIASLVVDPVDPRILYATTIPRTYPIRLLRSTDGGASWTVSPIVTGRGALSPVRCSVNVYKACIPPSGGRIVIDRQLAGSASASTLYFTASSHLLRSDDSGATFRPVFALPVDLDFADPQAPTLNPEAEFLRDAVVDPSRPDRLFAAVAQPRCVDSACSRAESVIRVYRSLDAGRQWTRQDVATLGPYSLLATRYADPGAVYVPRVRMAIAPSRPDTIALAFRDEERVRPRVVVSTDGGGAWAETPALPTGLTWPLALVISPTDANTMYVGSARVHRTTDGGQTWTALPQTHVDHTALAFDANGVLVNGNDGGIFLATSSGGFMPIHGSLAITEFYSVATHPSNGLLIAGGTQDNGTPLFQGSLGWSMITGGDGGDVIFEPVPGSPVLYAEIEWYFLGDGTNIFQFYRCQAGGCVERSRGIDKTVAGPFLPRVAMDPTAPSTLWLTAAHLFRTDDRAETWQTASPSVGAAERCWLDPVGGRTCAPAHYFTAVAVAPAASHTVYAGALNGDVWVTTTRGATWRSVAGSDAGPLPVRAVNDIAVDPLEPGTAYVAYSGFDANASGRGHVFRTTDGGSTWQDLTGNLPDVPVNTLLIDPDGLDALTPRVLYAGTDIGVLRIVLDGNSAWEPYGTGLPPVVVNRLAYNASTRQLLAATYGRGMWAISSRFRR